MGIGLGIDAIIAYSIGLILLYFLGSTLLKLCKLPIRIFITILINSIIGGLVLYVLNLFQVNIGVNPWNALICGIFGIPGLIMLVALSFIL